MTLSFNKDRLKKLRRVLAMEEDYNLSLLHCDEDSEAADRVRLRITERISALRAEIATLEKESK